MFGGITGYALKEGLSPPQAHGIAIGLFCTALRLSMIDSARMAQYGIDASAGDSDYSYAAHEGMDEFFDWLADAAAFNVTRLRSVLDRAPEKSD